MRVENTGGRCHANTRQKSQINQLLKKVGDGAGDFEYAVVGPRTHVHAFHDATHELTLS